MSEASTAIEQERQLLADASSRGPVGKLGIYTRLSGPGWVQSAMTLGGGSLASSLYLGVLGGYSLLWLQPVAMILGIIMLSTIGYVTLSTGERPFPAINRHINPVLGWSWALAVAAANVIWCMPQHSLAYGVLSKNLLPSGWFGAESRLVTWATGAFGDWASSAAADLESFWFVRWIASVLVPVAENFDKLFVSALILILCTVITWSYDRGGWGLRLYELVLKIIVAMIVLCFFGVVMTLTFSKQPLPWSEIFAGFVPDFGQIFRPAGTFAPFLEGIGPAESASRQFWSNMIVDQQRDVLISAAATAVGINMTFLYPYSMMRKGWTKEFRGLARFDLSTGMFIPFLFATSCVVIASASQFHTELPVGFTEQVNGQGQSELIINPVEAKGKENEFYQLIDRRNASLAEDDESATDASVAEQKVAAMLVKRNAFDMASSLAPLTGPQVANLVFGLGVLGMTLSTVSVLMLVSGFVFAEMLACPPGGIMHKLGTLVAGFGGLLWPFFWTGDTQFYLAIVTSVFGFMLLPFAYVTFAVLLNTRSLLKDEMPSGWRRFVANLLVFTAASVATIGAVYMVWVKGGYGGVAALSAIVVLAGLVAGNRYNEQRRPTGE